MVIVHKLEFCIVSNCKKKVFIDSITMNKKGLLCYSPTFFLDVCTQTLNIFQRISVQYKPKFGLDFLAPYEIDIKSHYFCWVLNALTVIFISMFFNLHVLNAVKLSVINSQNYHMNRFVQRIKSYVFVLTLCTFFSSSTFIVNWNGKPERIA